MQVIYISFSFLCIRIANYDRSTVQIVGEGEQMLVIPSNVFINLLHFLGLLQRRFERKCIIRLRTQVCTFNQFVCVFCNIFYVRSRSWDTKREAAYGTDERFEVSFNKGVSWET